jgi:hypothetical protein
VDVGIRFVGRSHRVNNLFLVAVGTVVFVAVAAVVAVVHVVAEVAIVAVGVARVVVVGIDVHLQVVILVGAQEHSVFVQQVH